MFRIHTLGLSGNPVPINVPIRFNSFFQKTILIQIILLMRSLVCRSSGLSDNHLHNQCA